MGELTFDYSLPYAQNPKPRFLNKTVSNKYQNITDDGNLVFFWILPAAIFRGSLNNLFVEVAGAELKIVARRLPPNTKFLWHISKEI